MHHLISVRRSPGATALGHAAGLLAMSLALGGGCQRAANRPDAAHADGGGNDSALPAADAPVGTCPDDLRACAYPPRGLATNCDPDAPAGPVDLTSVEESTGRTLPVRICGPTEGGPYPVVLWEHGGSFSATGSSGSPEWAQVIASHGYIVVREGHTPPGDEALALCESGGVTEADCRADGAIVHTVARPTDIITVLDDLPELIAAFTVATGVGGDTSHVGLGGWSGGTHGAMTVMGATRQLVAGVTPFSRPDPRPLATVMLSPSGPGFHHFFEDGTDHSWLAMRGPTLMITGTNDVKSDERMLVGAIRRRGFDLAPADGTHRLLYSNLPLLVGGHNTFNLADTRSSDPRLTRLSGAIVSTTLAFFDQYLKDDAAAAAYLESDHPLLLAGDASYERR